MPSRAEGADRALAPAQLKELYDRKARALGRRPELAGRTAQTELRVATGLRCELSDAAHPLILDLPAAEGGQGRGFSPDDLLRAALGASLAMGFKLWAARLELPVELVELEIRCHYDERGALMADGAVTPGWQRLIVEATVHSQAPAEGIARVWQLTQLRCPMLGILSPSVEQIFRLHVARGNAAVPSEVTPG